MESSFALQLSASLSARLRRSFQLVRAALEQCPTGLALALLGLIVVFRMPQAVFPSQFWAEEFSIFYVEDKRLGSAAFFKTYAGYLHLYPRILSFLLGAVPFEWAPFSYKVASVVSVIFVGATIAFLRLPFSRPTRVFLILLAGLVPGSGEVYLNTANAITLVGAIGILLYAQRPATTIASKLLESAALMVTGLSGAFMIFLFPVVGYRLALTDWPKKIYYRIAVLTVVTAINLMFYGASSRFEGAVSHDPEAWILSIINFNNGFLFGRLPIHGSGAHLIGGVVMVVMLMIVRHAVGSFGFWRSLKSEAFYFVGCGFAVWLASIYLFRSTPHLIAPYDGGGRYFYLPYFMLALACLCATTLTGRARTLTRWIVATSTVASILSFRPIPIVIQYKDFQFAQQVREIREKRRTALAIPPGWDVDVHDLEFP